MRTEFCLFYGCYLEEIAQHVIVEHPDDIAVSVVQDWLVDQYWEAAFQCVEGWYGQHGFEVGGDDEDEIHDFIAENTECSAEVWEEKVHEGMINNYEVDEIEYRE